MTSQSDLEADRTRLHTALGLDIDAHLDLLADAAVALRAENGRLKADNLGLINALEAEGFHNEAAAIRIADLEAAVHGRQLVIDGLNDIIAESTGVAGWHLNADVADWGTFEFVALASNYTTAALKGEADDNEG